MRVFVINLNKQPRVRAVAEILLVVTILLSLSLSIITKVFREDLFIEASSQSNVKVVILDAGHGGEDPGATGVTGIYEKDLNLEITMLVGRMLEERGYTVIYTRTEDKLLYRPEENIKGIRKISDLKNRCKIAAEHPDGVFISIHMNSFGSSKYSGLQVYYAEKNEGSYALAAKIQENVRARVQPENKRIVKAGKDIYVLENLNNCAVLIECGFLTNESECKKLSEKEYQKELSFAIICGIIEYIE